ncbi:MAG: GNAT family N-acetyltransferase [Spirochaetales bacterium]|nr:GNAT family N-acetyltransferase [Spirochaetales bacterium]
MRFIYQSIELRGFESGDYRLLQKWLNQQEIGEYLGIEEEQSLEQVKTLYPANKWKSPFMIVHDSIKVGFIHLLGFTENQNIRHQLAPDARTLSFDIAIGEMKAQSKGIGQLALASLVQMVQQYYRDDFLVLDTLPWNLKAIRCFEKSGFTQWAVLKNHEFRKGSWVDNVLFGMDLRKNPV